MTDTSGTEAVEICANCCQLFPRCECSRPRRTAVSRDDPRVYVRARERIFADIATECERRPELDASDAFAEYLRAHLIQVAARCVIAIEALDRNPTEPT